MRTERQLPSDGLPDVARSFVGEHLTIVEVIDWATPGGDGSREAVIDIHVKGAPLTIKGTLRLVPSGKGTAHVIDADLKANVPAHRRPAREGRRRADQRGHRHRDRAAAGVARPLAAR